MPQPIDYPLYDDYFTLLGPDGNQFGDPRFGGICAPQHLRNIILQVQTGIQVPAHIKKMRVGRRQEQVTVAEQTLSRWRIISIEDLIVHDQITPQPTNNNPDPQQIVTWDGEFEVSYYISDIHPGHTSLVIKKIIPALLILTATPIGTGVDLIWALQTGQGDILPDLKTNLTTTLLSWKSGLPGDTIDPTHLGFNTGIMRVYWEFK